MIFDEFFSKNENYKFVRTMRLNPGQSFDLSKEFGGLYKEMKKYSEYINNILSNKITLNNAYTKFDKILILLKRPLKNFWKEIV